MANISAELSCLNALLRQNQARRNPDATWAGMWAEPRRAWLSTPWSGAAVKRPSWLEPAKRPALHVFAPQTPDSDPTWLLFFPFQATEDNVVCLIGLLVYRPYKVR